MSNQNPQNPSTSPHPIYLLQLLDPKLLQARGEVAQVLGLLRLRGHVRLPARAGGVAHLDLLPPMLLLLPPVGWLVGW